MIENTLALCCKSKLVSTVSRIPDVLLVSFCRELTLKDKIENYILDS